MLPTSGARVLMQACVLTRARPKSLICKGKDGRSGEQNPSWQQATETVPVNCAQPVARRDGRRALLVHCKVALYPWL